MAKNFKDYTRNSIYLILDSIDFRINESTKFINEHDPNDDDYEYHVGRKEGLEVTKRQINRFFGDGIL